MLQMRLSMLVSTRRMLFPRYGDIIEETMNKVSYDKNPDYDVYVRTDAEARRVATEIMNTKF